MLWYSVIVCVILSIVELEKQFPKSQAITIKILIFFLSLQTLKMQKPYLKAVLEYSEKMDTNGLCSP